MPCLTGLCPSKLIQMIAVVADGLTAKTAVHCRSSVLLRKTLRFIRYFGRFNQEEKVSLCVCVKMKESWRGKGMRIYRLPK